MWRTLSLLLGYVQFLVLASRVVILHFPELSQLIYCAIVQEFFMHLKEVKIWFFMKFAYWALVHSYYSGYFDNPLDASYAYAYMWRLIRTLPEFPRWALRTNWREGGLMASLPLVAKFFVLTSVDPLVASRVFLASMFFIITIVCVFMKSDEEFRQGA